MCVWSFPKSSPAEEAKMLVRSGLHSSNPQSCQLFYRMGKDWAYSYTVSSVLICCHAASGLRIRVPVMRFRD